MQIPIALEPEIGVSGVDPIDDFSSIFLLLQLTPQMAYFLFLFADYAIFSLGSLQKSLSAVLARVADEMGEFLPD